ncbi:MAG: cytochrome c3 family protein [Desulfuromonadaceae bacterium]
MKTGRFLFMTMLVLLALLPGDSAWGKARGLCVSCHTMHNMQDGGVVDVGGPNQALLNASCVGCHSSSGTDTIVDLGNGTRIPIVFNLSEPTYPPDGSASSTLAGGNFYWVAQGGGDAYGHNVYGISSADSTLSFAPGRSTSCSPCHDSLASSHPSSGCKGCHVPAHHADDSAEVVAATGGWYRFLGENPAMMGDPSQYGVKGIEEEDWEQDPASNRHNGYLGTSDVYVKSFWPYLPTYSIGQFCVGCHGNFHHQMNETQPGDVSGAWIRHPSDVVIPDETEYAGYTTYNPLAPVAKTDLSGQKNSAVVVPGSDLVTCISCHRPHGSPNPDMLRWDYDTCREGIANAACGCFVCHSMKDD